MRDIISVVDAETKIQFTEAFPAMADSAFADELLSAATLKEFPEGALVYTEGDACDGIAFLLSGEIRVFKSGEGGREITLYEIGRGETCILNASCILSSKSYPANAVTVEAGKMLLIPAGVFRDMVAARPEMRDFVFSLLSERLSSVMSLVEEVAFGRMDRRLMQYLEEKSQGGELRSTHQKIADDLGTSREVVSRLLKDMERMGVVSLSRNHIYLLNI